MGAARQLSQVRPSRLGLVVTLASILLLTLAACGRTASASPPARTTCYNPFVIEHGPPYDISCYVTFAAGVPYAQALRTVADLGLRLANSCTERPGMDTLTTGGQETAFQQAQALVVATTTAASNVWLRQLQASAGVAAITTPYAPACP